MRHWSVLFIAVLISPAATAKEESSPTHCAADGGIRAVYEIVGLDVDGSGPKTPSQTVELWRSPTQVAIHYPDKTITELWEQTKNKKLHLVRYFDTYNRGIEYQPTEIKGSHDWSAKRHLLSDKFRKAMNLKGTAGEGCSKKSIYTRELEGRTYTLTWLDNLELVQSFSVADAKGSSAEWTLKSLVQNRKEVDAKFAELARYQTTDYADVGDNEADPFLSKMIYLGFIEHGHSGVYYAVEEAPRGHRHE